MVLYRRAHERAEPNDGIDAPQDIAEWRASEPRSGVSSISPGTKRLDRAFDISFAGAVLFALSPLLLLVAAVVKATSRGPVFYSQERAGLEGRPFHVLKFRSMRHLNDDSAHRELCRSELEGDSDARTTDGVFKLEDDPRVTRVGHLLRRWSIDELPQFFNVIRGDMAIVGPRPLPTWEVELIPAYYQQRARVRPGLTGLWQVSGRNLLNTVQMLELDVEYVRRRSWRLDFSILARTPRVLLRGDGAR
jgi:lipopolysaccharide/colanic/teichoic acid biosynthesis glycosyltransferase